MNEGNVGKSPLKRLNGHLLLKAERLELAENG